ncbi:hypothetical protein Tco_1134172 [Tanacetum coccineum]
MFSELQRVEGNELQVFEDLYTSELRKETLPIVFLASELSSLYPASYKVASYGLLDFWTKYNANIRATNILLQGLPKDIYTLINHFTDVKDIWDNVKILLEGSELIKEDRESQLYDDYYSQSSTTPPFTYVPPHFADNTQLDSRLSPMDNLIENLTNTLALLTQSYKTYLPQTNNQLRTSSNTKNQATVQDGRVVVQNVQGQQNRGQGNNAWGAGAAGYGGAQNRVRNANPGQARQIKCTVAMENGVALDEEQLLFIAAMTVSMFDSDVDDMANLSSAYHVYDKVGSSYDSNILSETGQKFELTEREQKINEQLRIVIADRNRKEENLKRELHSVKLQLTSTINHNKSMVEEVTSLKKDFKQKENKYLEEFLDMKALKEKVEDKLYKQDQSLQTPTLYNGHEIIKTNHVPAIVHNPEDTLEIAEITRKKMNDKMKDLECVKKKVKIAPHDYSKENYLATFTPQKQLTPKQIFWSKDLIKMKVEALKEQTTAS